MSALRELARENATQRALLAVSNERIRQHDQWGEQDLPDGTGSEQRIRAREKAKYRSNWAACHGGGMAWTQVLEEEVCEALAETDPVKLRAELVQVAAVAVQWIEAIDRRGAR